MPNKKLQKLINKLNPDQKDDVFSFSPMTEKEIEINGETVGQLRVDGQIKPREKQENAHANIFTDILKHEHIKSLFIKKIEHAPIKAVIKQWLSNLNAGTRKNYAYYVDDMIRRKIILEFDPKGNPFSVGNFNNFPHELIIDHIKKIEEWSEGTRQLHAACYISLTAYLNRITQGWFRRATPSKLAANPTFYQVRDKCATEALTLVEWHRFIDSLLTINHRDSLVARCSFQGAKRISEVIDATLDNIDWEKNIIHFRQKKTGGTIKEIPISFPQHFMDELKSYIHSTSKIRKDSPYLFVTRTGRRVTRLRCNYSFERASQKAKIKKVTPHMLRTTWVTIAKNQGVQDTEIMKVTGHTSSKMIYAYDKTSLEDNYTKKLLLV